MSETTTTRRRRKKREGKTRGDGRGGSARTPGTRGGRTTLQPASSSSLALNYAMARAEDGSEALTTGRINLMFAALAKLIPHTGHLKKSFDVVFEELYDAVYSPELTTVEESGDTAATPRHSREQSARRAVATTEVQRIPYAVLCQQLQDQKLSVEEEVNRAVQACERKHASDRRDLLNCRAEVEELQTRKRELEEVLSSEEARLGDKELRFHEKEKELRQELQALHEHVSTLDAEIAVLKAEVAQLHVTVADLQPYKDAHDDVQRNLGTLIPGNTPQRGYLKVPITVRTWRHWVEWSSLRHAILRWSYTAAVWNYAINSTGSLKAQLLQFRVSLVRDMEAANMRALRDMRAILWFPPPSTSSSLSTSSSAATSASRQHSCSLTHPRAFVWDPPSTNHEESMSMLKTVARELTMTAADMSRAKEKAQQFADRDTEAFEVVGQFYPQLKEPHLPATRPASLAVERRPEHVDEDDHKLLWRQLGTRRQFESLPPTLLSIEVVYAYITDLAGRVLAHDVQLAFDTATSEDDVISFQQHMYNMFDERFPHADAATLAIRDFLFSVEHHSSADPLVQLLFFSLVGKQDVSSLMHYTIVHMLIHTLQLSTPQHLSWLMTELFPDSHLSLDKLMLAYTGFADGAPSSDRISRFYLRETAARDWNPAAAEIVRVAAEVAGAPPTGSKPLSVIKCERIKHALHPHVPDQVLRLLYEQSAKIHGVDAELPSSVCTWLLLHARLLFETEMVRLSLKDRLDGLSEQQLLVNKRSRLVQLKQELAPRSGRASTS
ncbi:hypothetical protein PTSG_05797 [Salpingoeca rosetta]|uniref:Uncharacterized protein n=1 Tax=Salpingoeca rosetta (strain ATCC 50818 / BSB-021) TaxID=946362 RepID=F2UCT7_SALR5|nr:uncharacterized protein PTSG_05797 [Salpingoeca rosetta]EGD74432.1 hypothetical protein PTSG_05797 [Salpingoeca rosetta]|eukprot:XP_004992689.1 hypothetical protein PTSG_05797 [Salpingoeca rosetta]